VNLGVLGKARNSTAKYMENSTWKCQNSSAKVELTNKRTKLFMQRLLLELGWKTKKNMKLDIFGKF
jgi:hypothetical protein